MNGILPVLVTKLKYIILKIYFFTCSFSQNTQNRSYKFLTIRVNMPKPTTQYKEEKEHKVLELTDEYSNNKRNDIVNETEVVAPAVISRIDDITSRGEVQVSLTGLAPNTRYAMLVKVFNSVGEGPPSPAITAATAEDSKLPHLTTTKINKI